MFFLAAAVVFAQDLVYRISAPQDYWPSGWEPLREPARRLQASAADQQALLDKHNALRAGVNAKEGNE